MSENSSVTTDRESTALTPDDLLRSLRRTLTERGGQWEGSCAEFPGIRTYGPTLEACNEKLEIVLKDIAHSIAGSIEGPLPAPGATEDQQKNIRFTPLQYLVVKSAARLQGSTNVTAFIRTLVVEAALRVLGSTTHHEAASTN